MRKKNLEASLDKIPIWFLREYAVVLMVPNHQDPKFHFQKKAPSEYVRP